MLKKQIIITLINQIVKNHSIKLFSFCMFTLSSSVIASENLRSWTPKQYSFQAHPYDIRSVAFITNLLLATSDQYGGISLHDLNRRSTTTICESATPNPDMQCNVFLRCKDEMLFAHNRDVENFFIYNTHNGKKTHEVEVDFYSEILPDAADRTKFFVANRLGKVLEKRYIETNTVEHIHAIGGSLGVLSQNHLTHTLAFAQRSLMNSHKDGICLFDDRNLQEVGFYPTIAEEALLIPGSTLMLAVDYDKLELFDQKMLKPITAITTERIRIKKTTIDPLCRYIAFTNRQDGLSTCNLYSIPHLTNLWKDNLTNTFFASPSLSFSPDGEQLALGNKSGELKLFDVKQLLK